MDNLSCSFYLQVFWKFCRCSINTIKKVASEEKRFFGKNSSVASEKQIGTIQKVHALESGACQVHLLVLFCTSEQIYM